jgi:DNA-binding transcriptional ArsR family regulator
MPGKKKREKPERGAPPLPARVAELRALAHPLRLRIMELFAEGPRTTKQVAEILGQPPTRLYHHVNALERVGLLALRETRQNRGTVEKYYEARGRAFSGAGPEETAALSTSRPISALALAVLEQTRFELGAAIGRHTTPRPVVARLIAVGDTNDMREIRERIKALVEDVRASYDRRSAKDDPPSDDAERWALTVVFAPASTNPKPRKRR